MTGMLPDAVAARIMKTAGVDRGKPSRELPKEGESEKSGVGRVTYERGFHSLHKTIT